MSVLFAIIFCLSRFLLYDDNHTVRQFDTLPGSVHRNAMLLVYVLTSTCDAQAGGAHTVRASCAASDTTASTVAAQRDSPSKPVTSAMDLAKNDSRDAEAGVPQAPYSSSDARVESPLAQDLAKAEQNKHNTTVAEVRAQPTPDASSETAGVAASGGLPETGTGSKTGPSVADQVNKNASAQGGKARGGPHASAHGVKAASRPPCSSRDEVIITAENAEGPTDGCTGHVAVPAAASTSSLIALCTDEEHHLLETCGLTTDVHRKFEEDVLSFLKDINSMSVAAALKSLPSDCAHLLAKPFSECLKDMSMYFRHVKQETLGVDDEVDVFAPLWRVSCYRMIVVLEAYGRLMTLPTGHPLKPESNIRRTKIVFSLNSQACYMRRSKPSFLRSYIKTFPRSGRGTLSGADTGAWLPQTLAPASLLPWRAC